eukprot:Amastigsp_a676241_1052.p4 type:complete len:166 gc:universal Amastigsp_a676241_1052:2120-1623(-)
MTAAESTTTAAMSPLLRDDDDDDMPTAVKAHAPPLHEISPETTEFAPRSARDLMPWSTLTDTDSGFTVAAPVYVPNLIESPGIVLGESTKMIVPSRTRSPLTMSTSPGSVTSILRNPPRLTFSEGAVSEPRAPTSSCEFAGTVTSLREVVGPVMTVASPSRKPTP